MNYARICEMAESDYSGPRSLVPEVAALIREAIRAFAEEEPTKEEMDRVWRAKWAKKFTPASLKDDLKVLLSVRLKSLEPQREKPHEG